MHRPSSLVLTVAGFAAVATALPTVAGAQLKREHFQVHGYVTQGLAASDSLPVQGIGNRGTLDYRAAALQLRFAPTGKDAAVVQLSNRRMGASVLNAAEDAVHVQWAYYQRKLPLGFTTKLGRSPMARGIFNEVRKVGTVLPFYRAPYNFYTEGFETVDGAAVARTTSLGGSWELETNAFFGAIPYVQKATNSVYRVRTAMVNGRVTPVGMAAQRDTSFVMNRRGDKGLGGQLWLSTPISGLRIGAGGSSFELNDFHEFSGKDGRVASSIVQGAVDLTRARYTVKSEWQQQQSNEFLYTSHYQLVGVNLTDRLAVHAMREQANVHVAFRAATETQLPNGTILPAATAPSATRRNYTFVRDVAIGTSYAFRPNVILKVEAHDNKGSNYDAATSASPIGRFVITSLALSF